MARKIPVGGQEISTDTGGSFAPLPVGRYAATIYAIKDGKYTSEKNKGLANRNVQYRISDGQKGANRRLFDTFPDGPNWKNGKDAFRFHQFGAAVTNRTEKAFRGYVKEQSEVEDGAIELPDDHELLGLPVTLHVGVVDDAYKFGKALTEWENLSDEAQLTTPQPKQSDFQKNSITDVRPAGGGNMDSDGSASGGSVNTNSAVTLDEMEL